MAGVYIIEGGMARAYLLPDEIPEGVPAYNVETDEMVYDGTDWLIGKASDYGSKTAAIKEE